MIRQTLAARDQALALLHAYRDSRRNGAFRNLLDAILIAADTIEAALTGGSAYPKPYPRMAKWGFRWIKVHRYWFGWSMARGYPVVTNIFFETSRMWRRVATDIDDEVPF